LLAGVVQLEWQLAYIDQLRLHSGALLHFGKNKIRYVLAPPSLPGGSEHHRNKKRPTFFLHCARFVVPIPLRHIKKVEAL
jgi:hypothetical protein